MEASNWELVQTCGDVFECILKSEVYDLEDRGSIDSDSSYPFC